MDTAVVVVEEAEVVYSAAGNRLQEAPVWRAAGPVRRRGWKVAEPSCGSDHFDTNEPGLLRQLPHKYHQNGGKVPPGLQAQLNPRPKSRGPSAPPLTKPLARISLLDILSDPGLAS